MLGEGSLEALAEASSILDGDPLFVMDGLAAITVLVGVHLLALATEEFFVFNVMLVLCWLLAGVLLVREHRRASEAASDSS